MSVCFRRQRGFSAIIAVILIVLFALLGTYMATLSTIGSLNTSQSLGTMQAWFAAKSGLDWAVHDAVQNSAASLTCPGTLPSFPVSAGEGDNFDVIVTCGITGFTEAGTCTPCTTYALEVTAERGTQGDITYVSRTLRASVTDAP